MPENNGSKGSDKRKQSLYFPESMLQEIKDEAIRLDRSLSWVVQRAWKLARMDVRKIPSVNDIPDSEPSSPTASSPTASSPTASSPGASETLPGA